MKPFKILQMRSPVSAGGGITPMTHTYWRVSIPSVNTGVLCALTDVQFRATAGGADQVPVLTGSSASVLFSSDNIGNEAWRAFDSNLATNNGWAGNAPPPTQYIGYQFASAVAVEELVIQTYGDARWIPTEIRLDYSDNGTTWTTKTVFTGLSLSSGTVYTFSTPTVATAHSYWRIFCYDNNGSGSFTMLNEVQFRATSGGADQVPALTSDTSGPGTAICSSSAGAGNEAYKVFDNTFGTDWAAPTLTNSWVGFHFTSLVSVMEVALSSGSDFDVRYAKNMSLDYSDDGVTWTTQKTFPPQTTWGVNETRVLSAV